MYDFIDDVRDDLNQISPTEKEYTELQQLAELATNIGSYQWTYTGGPDAGDGKIHDGPIAQELLKVPGLKDAVNKDPNDGHLSIDTQYVSLATLGYVAALVRLIMKIGGEPSDKYKEDAIHGN